MSSLEEKRPQARRGRFSKVKIYFPNVKNLIP